MVNLPINRKNTEKKGGSPLHPFEGVGFDVPALLFMYLIEQSLLLIFKWFQEIKVTLLHVYSRNAFSPHSLESAVGVSSTSSFELGFAVPDRHLCIM